MPEDPSEEPEAHVGDRRLAEELFKRALDAHDANDLEEAYNLYSQVISADPSMEVAHNNIGMVLIDMGNYQEAISYLTQALELKPGYAEPYNNLGFVYRRLGDEVSAAKYYNKFLELSPDIEDAERIKAWVDAVLAQAGEQAPAEPAAGESDMPVVGLPSDDTPVGAPRQDAAPSPAGQQQEEPDIPAVGVPSEQTPAEESDDIAGLFQQEPEAAAPEPAGAGGGDIGSWLDGEEDASAETAAPPQAAQEESPAETPDTAQVLLSNAEQAYNQEDYQNALTLYEQVLELQPESTPALTGRAGSLLRLGRVEEGIQLLRDAAGAAPSEPSVHYLLGFALRQKGADAEAAEAYERFLELVPDAEDAPRIRQWIEEIRGGAGLPDDERHYNSGLTLFQEGNLEEALAQIEEALYVNENHGQANILLGRILLRKGDYIRAVAALKKAAEIRSEDPEVYYYLGQAFEKRGLNDEAREAYENCLAVSPSGPRADRIREWLDQARKSGETALGLRCEYCLRTFSAEELFDYQDKKACRECLSHLGVDADSLRETSPGEGEEELPEVDWETFEAEVEEKPRRSIFKVLLVLFLVLVLVAAVGLGVLYYLLRQNTIPKSYMEKTGVYKILRDFDLEKPLAAIGLDISRPGEDTGPVDTPGKDGDKVEGITSIDFLSRPPAAAPLLEMLMYEPNIRAEGEGEVKFTLEEAPGKATVDASTGRIAWSPLFDPDVQSLPFEARFVIKASSGGVSKTQEFRTKVEFDLRRRFSIKANIPSDMNLTGSAVADFNQDGRTDIVLTCGSFDKGRIEVYYRNTPLSFSGPKRLNTNAGCIDPVAADLDKDGDIDLAVLVPGRKSVEVFIQDEKRSLNRHRILPAGRFPVSLARTRGDSTLFVLGTDNDGLLWSVDAVSGNMHSSPLPYPVSVYSTLQAQETLFISNLPGIPLLRRDGNGWQKVELETELPIHCRVTESGLVLEEGFLVRDSAGGEAVVDPAPEGIVAETRASESDATARLLFIQDGEKLSVYIARGERRLLIAAYPVPAGVISSHRTGTGETAFVFEDGSIWGLAW